MIDKLGLASAFHGSADHDTDRAIARPGNAASNASHHSPGNDRSRVDPYLQLPIMGVFARAYLTIHLHDASLIVRFQHWLGHFARLV